MGVSIGNRVFEDVRRPSKELIESFAGIPSSNIGDNCGRLYCTNGTIRPFNDKPLLGPAFTVKVPLGDNCMIHVAMDLIKEGDILVIDGGGCEDRSLLGEMMMRYLEEKRIGGIVIDGAIRDCDYCKELPFPLYAKAVTPQGPYKNGPGEINVPVCCAGQVVFPGDILAGDADGIVVIHPDQAEELAAVSRKKKDGEVTQREKTQNGEYMLIHKEQYGRQTANLKTEIIKEAYSAKTW